MEDLESIYICAVRYSLGRRTYITSLVSDFIIRQELSNQCKSVMERDIEDCDDYGDNCDKESWMKLLNKLKE